MADYLPKYKQTADLLRSKQDFWLENPDKKLDFYCMCFPENSL